MHLEFTMGGFLEIYTAEQIAKQFKLHPYTVRRLARAKKIPAFRFGGQWRFRGDEISEWSKYRPAPKPYTPFSASDIASRLR
jgi:excisionase family DNA binding protein